jgi:hypothetical protein
MRKWLYKWLGKGIEKDIHDTDRYEKMATAVCSSNKVRTQYEDDGAINFRIYGANGGKIVETVRYDAKMGREKTSLYIIADGDDFHESVSKIITLEYLQ